MSDSLARLRQHAEAVMIESPPPWRLERGAASDVREVRCAKKGDDLVASDAWETTAAFIAACDPPTVLALIAIAEAAAADWRDRFSVSPEWVLGDRRRREFTPAEVRLAKALAGLAAATEEETDG